MESSIMLKGIWWFVKTWLLGVVWIFLGSFVILCIVAAVESGWLQWIFGIVCLIIIPFLIGIRDEDLP